MNNHDPDQQMHADEFPDDHSHIPQQVDDGVLSVYVTDDEGRHYLLQHATTDEGVIIDLYDRYGEENLSTLNASWDELAELVYRLDPRNNVIPCSNCGEPVWDVAPNKHVSSGDIECDEDQR